MKKEKLPLIGAHTSAAGGVWNALHEGRSINATTVQLFTSNQKQWSGKKFTQDEIQKWKNAVKETGIEKVMSHDSYLINLGSPKEEALIKSRQAFREEVERCQALDVTYLNFHPGAALSSPKEECLDTIVQSLLELEEILEKGITRLLLETTAGQGSSVGASFEEIGYIVERVSRKIPIGVCIDTCHIFAAGYDIRDRKGWDETLETFDKKIGLSNLYAFHVNDSLKPLGSRVDRHAPLGEGLIGWSCFEILMTHPKTADLPKYLETPGGPPLWIKEIEQLKNFYLRMVHERKD